MGALTHLRLPTRPHHLSTPYTDSIRDATGTEKTISQISSILVELAIKLLLYNCTTYARYLV